MNLSYPGAILPKESMHYRGRVKYMATHKSNSWVARKALDDAVLEQLSPTEVHNWNSLIDAQKNIAASRATSQSSQGQNESDVSKALNGFKKEGNMSPRETRLSLLRTKRSVPDYNQGQPKKTKRSIVGIPITESSTKTKKTSSKH